MFPVCFQVFPKDYYYYYSFYKNKERGTRSPPFKYLSRKQPHRMKQSGDKQETNKTTLNSQNLTQLGIDCIIC